MVKKNENYAVIRITGKQYKVFEGQEILVDKIKEHEVNADILLVVNGENVQIGKPLLDKAKVNFKILGEEKGDKIRILKYKAKSRYRRHLGFRSQFTRLKVEKISF